MNALTNLKCTLALSAGFCSSFANAQKQPHIILIMTDQQRGDAVGCMGNEFVITPHLDKLANEGTLIHECLFVLSQQHTCPCRIVDRNVAVASRNVRIWTGSAEV